MADSDIGSLWFTIGARVDDLMNVIKVVQDQLNTLGGNAQKNADDISAAFGRVWMQFSVGQLAANALQSAMSGVKEVFSSSIQSAMAAEQSEMRLATAMEMTGRARSGGTEALMAFATEQAKVTTFTHEEIEASSALLAQLTHLSTSGIEQATKGAMGLATVLGRDLQSATLMMSKALDGNVQGLRRAGIEIDGTLPKEQLQAQIIEKTIALYGRATAETGTFSGQVKQLGKDWEVLKEKFGEGLIEFLKLPGVVKATVDALNWLHDQLGGDKSLEKDLKKNIQAVKDFQSSLVYMKPSMADLQKAIEKGPEAWEAYKKSTLDADAQVKSFVPTMKAATDAVIAWMDKMGLTDKPTYDLEENMKKLGITSDTVLRKGLADVTIAFNAYLASAGPHAQSVIDDFTKKINAFNVALGNTILVETGVQRQSTTLASAMQILDDEFTGANVVETGLQKQSTSLAYALNVLAVDTMTLAQRIEYLKGATDEQSKSLLKYYEDLQKVLDGTRELSTKTKSLWDDMGRSINRTVTQLGSEWGNYVDQLVNGTNKFKDIFIEIFKSIEAAFFKIVGEMVARWLMAMTIMKIAASFLGGLFGLGGAAASSAISTGGGIGAAMDTGLIFTQQGFEGVVTSPQLFMAGEAGPEYVSVTPMAGGGMGGGGEGGNYNLTFNISALDGTNLTSIVKNKIVPILRDCLQRRTLTIPEYAIGGR